MDNLRRGRPLTSTDYTSEVIVNDILKEDQRKACGEIALETRMSVTSVYRIITEKLQVRNVAARWVIHHLSEVQKAGRKRIAEEFLQRYQTEGEQFLKRTYAIHYTWIRDFELEMKSQSSQWKHSKSPRPKKMSPATIEGETDNDHFL